MGVPKFFRYISERYPCLSELVKEHQIPEFDNLYLDMNGIIHMCSHPDDYDPHFRISEEKIFTDIFHYIEILFRMIKPQKLFFMAVDGVAPRAKMNQQRGRRFRSAKEAEMLEAKAKEKGEILPKEARFDSNCITPGTVFMARLHEQLKYFVSNKISTDKLWQQCKVVLSGQETPGEGEHKIMDYIRFMKAQPGYNPNTRHCLYGLDADLVMLGLCSHEPNFSLLREEVRFGKKAKRKTIPEQINFYLLHLSLLREYLQLEFLPLKDSLPFEYDMEKIIDDWVLMGFLVGNDFIPNLPNLHISNGALPLLYNAYMKILPTLNGYINEFGKLNLERFEKFMTALAAIDMAHFSDQYEDLKYFHAKTGRRPNTKDRTSYKPKQLESFLDIMSDEGIGDLFGVDNAPAMNNLAINNLKTLSVISKDSEFTNFTNNPSESTSVATCSDSVAPLTELLVDLSFNEKDESIPLITKSTNSKILEPSDSNLADLALDELELHDEEDGASPFYSASDSDDDNNSLMNAEFIQHKIDYYMNKLDYCEVTPDTMRDQAEGYVRAIQWNLNYYYNGVCSWSWYYPHHYAPYISDIKDFASLKLEYELGTPFKPFEQLLAVLPAASKTLLPEPYQKLMTSEESQIIEYYPEDFRTDLNGKKQDWEAVVLIPFIAEDLLLKAMGPCNEQLTKDEKKRNSHGPMLVYQFTADDLGPYEPPEYFPTIKKNYAKLTPLTIEDIRVPIENLIKGLCPGSIHDVYYPGFPTFKYLKYSAQLMKAKVRVFDSPSQNENMVISIMESEEKVDIEDLARKVLGNSVYVAWPHLVEATVMAVSDSQCRYLKSKEPGKFNLELNKGNLGQLWYSQKQGITFYYKEKFGIEVGKTDILLHVKVLVGEKYSYLPTGRVSLEKQWASVEMAYPFQAVVQDLLVYEGAKKNLETIQDIFPLRSKCFMLANPYYGSMGEVTDNTTLKSGRVRVSFTVLPEPDLSFINQFQKDIRYMNAFASAQRLTISPHLLSRITGCIFVIPGVKGNSLSKNSSKINIGLNLKLNKKNEEIPGYTKKVEGQWLYSQKAIHLVQDYMNHCPELFTYITAHLGVDIFYESELFPTEIGEGRVQQLVDWLKNQSYYNVERQKVGSCSVDEEVSKKIEETVDKFNNSNKNTIQPVNIQVKPHLLYNPGVQTATLPPDKTATYQLYDRVVNVREGHSVPFGEKGTIIGISNTGGEAGKGEENNEAVYDILFDVPFPGGLKIHCSSHRCYRVPKTALINISHGMRQVQEMSVKTVPTTAWTNNPPQQQQQQQQQQQMPSYNNQHHQPPFYQQQNNHPVQSPNSAFANWTPANGNYQYRRSFPPKQQYPLQNIFMPNFTHRMPMGPPQQPGPRMGSNMPPQRPLGPPQPHASNEFLEFFKDLQKTQTEGKPSGPVNYSSLIGQPLQQVAQYDTNASQKSPVTVFKKDTTDETETLKKLLNIAGKSSPSKSTADDNKMTQQISVQDLFTVKDHARNKEQKLVQQCPVKLPGFSVQLLNYCQGQHIGVPRYTYFRGPNGKIRAQVVLLDGRKTVGEEANNREEAAELAANVLMGQIVKMNSPLKGKSQNRPNDTKSFPVPPKQWYQGQKGNQNQPGVNVPEELLQHQTVNKTIASSQPLNKTPPKDSAKSTSFVPLQAVKQQRTKSTSNDSNTSTEKGEHPTISKKHENIENSKNTSNTNSVSSPDHQSESTSDAVPKPRRRRCRIAANFSGLEQQK